MRRSGAAARTILAAPSAAVPSSDGAQRATGGHACPFAAECRVSWRHLAGTDTAECGHCYQTLTRTDLARILAGT